MLTNTNYFISLQWEKRQVLSTKQSPIKVVWLKAIVLT